MRTSHSDRHPARIRRAVDDLVLRGMELHNVDLEAVGSNNHIKEAWVLCSEALHDRRLWLVAMLVDS